MNEPSGAITHVAGLDVCWADESAPKVGRYLRQRCACCGAVLIDYDLARIGVPIGQEGPPPTWQVGALVRVDGAVSALVGSPGDEGPMPADCCMRLDPEVTA